MFVPSLLAVPDVRNVEFQFCMHGGDRDQKSRVLASGDFLGPLLATSDGQHHHAPWLCALHSDRFRRSHRPNEGAYSTPLRDKCETVVADHGAWTTRACVKAAAISPGTRVGRRAIHADSHAAANVQHRSDAFEFVPEFKTKIFLDATRTTMDWIAGRTGRLQQARKAYRRPASDRKQTLGCPTVHAVRCADVRDGQATWCARVPSISNISDGLSRFDCTVVKEQGGCLDGTSCARPSGNMVMVRGRAISETATASVTVLVENKRKSELHHDLHCTVAYFTCFLTTTVLCLFPFW